jgi:hypothetical protein
MITFGADSLRPLRTIVNHPLCRPARRACIVPIIVLAGISAPACSRQPPKPDPPRQVVVWRAVGSWSGHGNRQTESFTSDSGALRIRWATRHEDPGGAAGFRVTAHSAISGRLLQEAVDHRGTGSGVAYVNQDPHVFYLMVESDHLDWTLSAEEAIAGAAAPEPRAR